MKKVNMDYTIQCTAENGEVGCFGYVGTYPSNYKRITPVFPSLIEYYDFVRENEIAALE